jgi:hypothetical protein
MREEGASVVRVRATLAREEGSSMAPWPCTVMAKRANNRLDFMDVVNMVDQHKKKSKMTVDENDFCGYCLRLLLMVQKSTRYIRSTYPKEREIIYWNSNDATPHVDA